MATTTFDALDYFEKLKATGVPEEQAKIQANAFRDFSTSMDEKTRLELATKGDLREIELRLRNEMSDVKHEILKWIMTAILAQTALIVAPIGVVIAYLPK